MSRLMGYLTDNTGLDNSPRVLFGELLKEEGLISQLDLEQGLEYSKINGYRLGKALLELSKISEDQLLQHLAMQRNLQYICLRSIDIDESLRDRVGIEYAQKYNVLPIRFDNGELSLASPEPLDLNTIDDLCTLFDCQVKILLANSKEITDFQKKIYGVGAKSLQGIKAEKKEDSRYFKDDTGFRTDQIGDLSENSSIISFINLILVEAFKARATDIHFEPFEDYLVIRYRIDGVLQPLPTPQNLKEFQSEITSRIKIMSRLNITERRLPQDGRCKIKINDTEFDLRISTLPSIHGETINIRFLNQSDIVSGFNSLGIDMDQEDLIRKAIIKPHGMILTTGPTGSGKTTTLYSCLNELNTTERKIITVEDPVEYQLRGISQIQVDSNTGLSFSNGLRSMLRHDPDIMMVGEIRDHETAQVAIQIALTGHLLFSSVHTNNATSTIVRLMNMGIEPYLISSSLNCVIAQRLVRIICPNCRRTVSNLRNDGDLNIPIELDGNAIDFFEGIGCDKCNNTGFAGRTGIFEVLIPSEELLNAAFDGRDSRELRRIANRCGMRSLWDDGISKVRNGVTTIGEVLRVTQESD